jgi:hypothetical protein
LALTELVVLTLVGAKLHDLCWMGSSPQRRSVREWWRTQPHSLKCWNLFATSVALTFLAIALTNSRPELKAIRWRHKNGGRAVIHGLSFPISFWHSPEIGRDVLDIWDTPGPLRPGYGGFVAIHISWLKNDRYAGLDRLSGMNAAQRAQEKRDSFERAGYQNVQLFSHRYLDQDFDCVRELDPRFNHPGGRGGDFSCYGDGPVYLIFFAGSEKAEYDFEAMITNVTTVGAASR